LLLANKISADFYHGGLTREERSVKQDNWLANKTKVIVATNAFGMGIDKPDVRYVLHYEFPDSLEAYYQEAGRAGRDGLPARTLAFLETGDLDEIQRKVDMRFPDNEDIKRVYRALCNYLQIAIGSGKEESFPINIADFIKRYDFDAIMVFNSLKILELNKNIVFSENALYQTRMRFIVGNKQVYNFQVKYEKCDKLVAMISRTHSGIFDQFVDLDERGLMKQLRISKNDLLQQLKFIEANGIAEFNWKTELPQVTFLHERLPDDYLTIAANVLKTRKEVALEKLSKVKDYLTKPLCRSIQLVNYFGQEGEKCGSCDVCRAERKKDLTKEEITAIVLEKLESPLSYMELKQHIGSRYDKELKEIVFQLTDEGNIELKHDKLVRIKR
jgi:ATP-dependent DNA helicase RecQ